MKRKSAEIKRIARESLTGHYGLPMGAMVVSQLIVTLPTMFFSWNLTPYSGKMEWAIYYVAAFILALLGVVLNIGILQIALRMGRKQPYKFTDMFYGFNHHPDKYILAYLLFMVVVLVPMLPAIAVSVGMYVIAISGSMTVTKGLFIGYVVAMCVLGIGGEVIAFILSLRYSMLFLILLEDNTKGIRQAMRESKALMQGNKGRYFYIMLSFLGWSFLGLLSFGIGFLWIGPYYTQTQVTFYRDITGELDRTENQTDPYGTQQQNPQYSTWSASV